jgi:hypothetical protein
MNGQVYLKNGHIDKCIGLNYWKPNNETLQQTILSLKSKLEDISNCELFDISELAEEGLKEIGEIGL